MGRKKSAATLYKESVTYPEYVLDGIVPYMETISDDLKRILSKGNEISKDEWDILKGYASEFCKIAKESDCILNTFDVARMEDAKYKKAHSSYYNVVASDHIRYALNKLGMVTDDIRKHQFYMYNAALHVFFYVICPEKI